MKQLWARLETYLQANNPELLADLAPPASDIEIYELEHKLGVTLPTDFIESLKIHNGQKGKSDWLFSDSEFLSSQRILAEWGIWKNLLDEGNFNDAVVESETGIKPVWWSSMWIPFTYNGKGDHLCIDIEPCNQGRIGQVITLWHDDCTRKKKADSFTQWFSQYVNQL